MTSGLLAGKRAFVTGATRGIGRATAELFARHGAAVAVNGRDAAACERVAAEVAATTGAQTLPVPADSADPASIRAAYQAIFKAWKGLDVLVNNAGILEDALVGMITDDLVDRVIAVNTKGVIHHLQGAARLMQRSGGGAIVNLTSIIGTRGNKGQVVYGASKAAVIGATLSAAKELAPKHIRVNAVAPGFIETDMVAGLPADKRTALVGAIASGRPGTADDVANGCLFLASDLSAYVTGQVLGIDGGLLL